MWGMERCAAAAGALWPKVDSWSSCRRSYEARVIFKIGTRLSFPTKIRIMWIEHFTYAPWNVLIILTYHPKRSFLKNFRCPKRFFSNLQTWNILPIESWYTVIICWTTPMQYLCTVHCNHLYPIRNRPQRWSIFRAMRCRWFIFQQRCDTDYFWKSLTSPSSQLFSLTIGNDYFLIILLILGPIILGLLFQGF